MKLAEHPTSLDWDELLLFIAEHRVIPIIGRELLTIDGAGGERTLEDRLAGQLAEALELPADRLSARPSLDEVAAIYVAGGGQRRKVYSKLRTLTTGEQLPPPPEPLRQLAEIGDFRLFLSTTFDPLLADALDAVRFGGERRTLRLAFSPHLQLEDLPCEARRLADPVVFQVFGRVSASADYAVTEEDVLELLHVLQSEGHRPPLLFDALRSHHLLFLGCGFPDWLARFFIRTLANKRLLIPRETSEIVADRAVATDPVLSAFLRLYSTEVVGAGGAAAFVAELHRRWCEQNGNTAPLPRAPIEPQRMPPGAIFLSYTSEDQPVAAQLAADLGSAGLEVWLDKAELQAGDAWDLEIRRNIQRCSLFIPLLSHCAQRRYEGYFRREWHWAIERARGFDESIPFIIPIVIDELPAQAEGFPDFFWSRQIERLGGGCAGRELVDRLRAIVRELRRREAGWS